VDVEYTKLETWDAHRAKSLCYGRRKAQTTNNQSKQYLELKKEWTQYRLQTTLSKSSEKIPQNEVVEQRWRRRGRGKEGGAKRNVRFWRVPDACTKLVAGSGSRGLGCVTLGPAATEIIEALRTVLPKS
jgi:hypothetical protein